MRNLAIGVDRSEYGRVENGWSGSIVGGAGSEAGAGVGGAVLSAVVVGAGVVV